MKKRVSSNLLKKLIVCATLLIVFSFFLFYGLSYLSPDKKFTGHSLATASVTLTILTGEEIFIHSPLNTTYNFNIGENYTLDLNVSANFDAVEWWYTLWDLKHNVIVNDSITFSPNTTFEAIRWSNKLIVYADSGVTIPEAQVIFFVEVPNSAPILGDINSSIYACEGQSLDYDFNITDIDEQFIRIDISPKNPFYVNPTSFNGNVYMFSSIISGVLDKYDVGGTNNGSKVYGETVSASDGEYVDTKDTNITVIEINNKPVIENIGVQTVWLQGENSTFYKQVQVTDIEDGDQDSGTLGFNISFSGEELFNISSNGVMNFTPNSSQIGIYNISVCVNDTGIDNPHENISNICNQDGGPLITCQNFSLTVTDENRAPTIVNYYPVNLSLNVSGTDNLYFNISKYDPEGTIPDAYWYVDGVLKEYDSGSSADEFNYSFGCGVSGVKSVRAEVTDGLLNDSVTWTLNVTLVECLPVEVEGPGRGGGILCTPQWVCDEWSICQNLEKSLKIGSLFGEDYRIIKEQCIETNLNDNFCGMQIRTCFDLNNCSINLSRPVEVQFCYYTEEPSCYDGIKNCHDGSCELLVDCGGPCASCPTCSDGTQNQGEEGIDCGGPCPWKCEIEKPLLKKLWLLWILLLIILLLLLIIIIIKIRRILKLKKSIGSKVQNHKL